MATKEECMKAVEDLSKALNVSSDKSETITKHILDISEEDAEKYGEIIKAVKTTYGAMKKLKSNEPAEVISGVLDTVGAFSALAGPAGMVLSGICGLISGIISDSSGDDGNNFQKLIDAALEQARCSELKEEAGGVGKVFAEWQIYMSNGNSRLTEKELDKLTENYDLQTGTGFLGELLEHIKEQKTKRKDTESAKNLLHLIELYCQLSITREMLLHQMIILIANSEGSEELQSTVKSYRAITDNLASSNENIKFLHCPSMKEIVMASVYLPSEWPEIAKYLKHVGVQDVAVPEPYQTKLCVEKWPDHGLVSKFFTRAKPPLASVLLISVFYLFLKRYKVYYLTTKKKSGHSFSFEQKNGLFKITDLKREGYLSKEDIGGYWGLNGVAKTSSFKLIITDNDKCLLSCTDSPHKFMYVTKTGYLDMYEGDPGKAGYWKIETTTPESLVGFRHFDFEQEIGKLLRN